MTEVQGPEEYPLSIRDRLILTVLIAGGALLLGLTIHREDNAFNRPPVEFDELMLWFLFSTFLGGTISGVAFADVYGRPGWFWAFAALGGWGMTTLTGALIGGCVFFPFPPACLMAGPVPVYKMLTSSLVCLSVWLGSFGVIHLAALLLRHLSSRRQMQVTP